MYTFYLRQKKELERKFAQSTARVDALMHSKNKAGTDASCLEEANRNLRYCE